MCSLYFWAVESFSTRICCKLITNWLTFKHFNMSRKQFFHFQIIKYHNHTVWLRCARVCVWVCECECSICIYSVSNFNNFIIVAVRKVSWVFFFFLFACVFHFTIYSLCRRRHTGAVCLPLIGRSVGYVGWLLKCAGRRGCHAFMRKKRKLFRPWRVHHAVHTFEISAILWCGQQLCWVICWLRDTENVE